MRTIVDWSKIAATKPAHAANPFDRAYRFDDLDEFVRNAQQRGVEVLLTLWGTPAWANGGRAPNVAPTDAADFGAFARAVARRYSGAYPGYPFARFFGIWNEPNNDRFLTGADTAGTYADLAAAGYAGVKGGSPGAMVAIGETSSRHAPAAFMEDVARARPDLNFDAWAHHPYAPTADGRPDDAAVWPDVGFHELARFGQDLDRSFHRTRTPVWLTEYAESATAVPAGALPTDVARAIQIARELPRVEMFVWLMMRNHAGEPWQSGLEGTPALAAFRSLALKLDPRNDRVQVEPGRREHVFRLPALELKWHIPTAARVGIHYTLRSCGRTLAAAAPGSRIEADGWVPLEVAFVPQAGRRYVLRVDIEDIHGFRVRRTLDVVASGNAATATAPPDC